jgi:uncharacterized Ntn-hydrolase superfamily protein
MTHAILGWAEDTGDLGVAVQSRFPGVGSLVPYGETEVGVVATQAFANPRHGSSGLTLLRCGATPQQAVEVLLDGDPSRSGTGWPAPTSSRRWCAPSSRPPCPLPNA